MKVICAGLSKTGTTSLAKALEVLGYNTYHFKEHITFHRQEWLDSFETDRLPNFKDMYHGVDAITDIPPAFWFEEIAAVFPEAKVILTVRDSEEVWLKSWKEHLQLRKDLPIFSKIAVKLCFPEVEHFMYTIGHAIYGSRNPEATTLFRVKYRQHNERVQAVIPAEKLLVLNVKEGWKPLCEFLGCDVPSTQFPRANVARANTKVNMAKMAAIAKSKITRAFFFVSVTLVIAAVFVAYIMG